MPIMIPASLSTATLFPLAAMRVRRLAEPLSEVPREEKDSLCESQKKGN